MTLLPNTLLAVRHRQYAILIAYPNHTYAQLIGGRIYDIPYHGYRLSVAIMSYDIVVNNSQLIVSKLGNRATLAFL
jgi:hypothetical protein